MTKTVLINLHGSQFIERFYVSQPTTITLPLIGDIVPGSIVLMSNNVPVAFSILLGKGNVSVVKNNLTYTGTLLQEQPTLIKLRSDKGVQVVHLPDVITYSAGQLTYTTLEATIITLSYSLTDISWSPRGSLYLDPSIDMATLYLDGNIFNNLREPLDIEELVMLDLEHTQPPIYEARTMTLTSGETIVPLKAWSHIKVEKLHVFDVSAPERVQLVYRLTLDDPLPNMPIFMYNTKGLFLGQTTVPSTGPFDLEVGMSDSVCAQVTIERSEEGRLNNTKFMISLQNQEDISINVLIRHYIGAATIEQVTGLEYERYSNFITFLLKLNPKENKSFEVSVTTHY